MKKKEPIDDEYMRLSEASRYTGLSRYLLTKYAKQSEEMGLSKFEKGKVYVSWTLIKILKRAGYWVIGAIILYYVLR